MGSPGTPLDYLADLQALSHSSSAVFLLTYLEALSLLITVHSLHLPIQALRSEMQAAPCKPAQKRQKDAEEVLWTNTVVPLDQ